MEDRDLAVVVGVGVVALLVFLFSFSMGGGMMGSGGMMGWNSGWGMGASGGGILMFFVWLIFLVVIIAAAIWLVKYFTETREGTEEKTDPLTTLKQRYARGEITREEFQEAKTELEK